MMFYFCTFVRQVQSESLQMQMPCFYSAVFSVHTRVQDPVAKMNLAAQNEFVNVTMILCRFVQPEDYQALLKQKGIRSYTIDI